MIKDNHIQTYRTARYYTSGELSDKTKSIWFVIHGYGQLARDFIKEFEELVNDETFIVAPEALSRFYLDSGTGSTGASWMTKEDRENEINDYVNYLDELYLKIVSEIKVVSGVPLLTLNALGFSQGVSTLSRWAAMGKSKFEKLIFWAGDIAKDIDTSKFINTEIHLVIGNKDRYFPGVINNIHDKMLDDNGIKYETTIFDGGHEIKMDVLKKILNRI